MWHACTPVTQAEQNADVAQKPELTHLEASPAQTHTHTHTPKHTRLPGPPFSPGRGCFSAHTYVSALRRYQACLMQ